MGGTGYQPVPLGNLPRGMSVRLLSWSQAVLVCVALTLPPGW